MRATTKRGALLETLGKVKSAVAARHTLPVLGAVMIRAGGGQLTLTATNLEVSLTAFCKATVTRQGAIAVLPKTLEAFLKAREAVAPNRQRLETSFEQLTKDRRSFAAIRRGLGVIPQVADYLRARNEALLDAGMGMGEYFFIYVIAYESYLKKPMDDGPGFRFPESGGIRTDWDRESAKEMQKDFALRRIHRVVLPMLKNQLAKPAPENAVPGEAAGTTGRGAEKGAPSKWQEALAAEVKAMEADPHRLPWQDGLPEVLESSLKPFRDRLEASYSPMTNIFEISYERK